MAKRNVVALDNETTAFRRLSALGIGLGTLLDSLVTLARAVRQDAMNYVLSAGSIAMATTTQRAKSVGTITYTINGALKSKAGTDNLWILPATVVPQNSFCKFALLLDATGVATVIAGTPAPTAALAVLPTLDLPVYAGVCVVGILQVATGAVTFTGNTTALNAANVTSTFVDGIDGSQMPSATPALV